MREMYMHNDDNDTSSFGGHGNDPFYDHSTWFKSIGYSYMFISNLLIPVSLVRKVAIVAEKGDVKGHLTVSVRYVAGAILVVRIKCNSVYFIEDEMDDSDVAKCVVLNFDQSFPREVSIYNI